MGLQILALIIWSSSFIAAKYAYQMFDPVLLVQLRLFIAVLPLLPLLPGHLRRIPRNKWPLLLALTFANYICVLLLQFIGLKYTSVASAVTILGLEPLLTVFVGHFFFNDRAQPYHWLCGLLALVGVVLMISGGDDRGEVSFFGCFLILLGGVAFSVALRPTQQFIREIDASAYTSLSLALAGFLCLPFTLTLVESYHIAFAWSGLFSLFYLAVGCSWLAYWLWNRGMGQVPANLAALLTPLEPLFGSLMAVLLLGERPSALAWLGVALVLMATISAALVPVLRRRRRRRQLAEMMGREHR